MAKAKRSTKPSLNTKQNYIIALALLESTTDQMILNGKMRPLKKVVLPLFWTMWMECSDRDRTKDQVDRAVDFRERLRGRLIKIATENPDFNAFKFVCDLLETSYDVLGLLRWKWDYDWIGRDNDPAPGETMIQERAKRFYREVDLRGEAEG